MSDKEVYRSREWKALDPLDRACILLVAEGVKPGATFGSEHRGGVERVLEELRLPYLPPEWDRYDYTYTAARDDKTLSDYLGKLLKINLNQRQAHRAHGIFYGYPECCIDKYVSSFLEYGKGCQRKSNVPFNNLLKEYERLNGSYPEELDYRIPVMVPCKVDCGDALKVLRKYRDVLLEYDSEAAEELKLFNKCGYRIVD